MLLRWTYYLIPRLILGMVLSLFAAYGVLYIYNEALFPGTGGLAGFLVSLTVIVAFAVGWTLWTTGGRFQVRRLLECARSAADKREYERSGRYYRRAGKILNSSHFPPGASSPDKALFINRYADYCCGAGANHAEALTAYEEYLKLNPEDDAFARRIIPLVINSGEISDETLPLFNKLHNLVPDSDEMTDFLAEQYLIREIFNPESQEVLIGAIKSLSPLRHRSLNFLLSNMIEWDRLDPIALEIYLESFKAGLEHPKLKLILGRIADKARYEDKPGPLTEAIKEAFESLPAEEITEIENALQKQRLDRIPLTEKQISVSQFKQAEIEETLKEEIFRKPNPVVELLKNAIRFTTQLPAALPKAVMLTYKGTKYALGWTFSKWGVIRWIIAGALVAVVIFGLVKTVSFQRAPSTSSLEVVSDKPFTIQIAAFKDRTRAERAIKELNIPGLKAYISATGGETVWYQIRLGHYDSLDQARKAADELKKKRIISNYFIANFTSGKYIE